MPMLLKHGMAVLLAALAAIATGPAAAVVVVTNHRVLIEVGDALVPTITVDPVFASNTVGNSFASADLMTGIFKASTFVTGALGFEGQLARSSGIVNMRNDDLMNAVPFTLSAHLTATFAHTIGPNPLVGGFGNQLSSSVFVGPTFGSAGVTYQHGVDTFIVQPADVSLGGMTVINTGTENALAVDFLITGSIPPGATFDLQLANLNAFASQSAGWSALVDASNTFAVSMVFPAGVTFDSPIPMAWVTTATAVPEPDTYALVLAGLGFMTWVAKRRRKSA